MGEGVAPAGEARNLAPGRPRDPTGRHYDRSAGCLLDWDRRDHRATSQEARTRGQKSPRWSAGRRGGPATDRSLKEGCACRRSVPLGVSSRVLKPAPQMRGALSPPRGEPPTSDARNSRREPAEFCAFPQSRGM